MSGINVNQFVTIVVQGLLYVLIAPLAVGTLRWLRARLQGRQGPSLFQFYRDLAKLWRKPPLQPETASWLFAAVPYTVFICYALLGVFFPTVYLMQTEPQLGDLLFLVYLLGLAKFVTALGGMDAGAPFGGSGSSREMFMHVLVEPTLILCLYALALQWHTSNLTTLIAQIQSTLVERAQTIPTLLLVLLALVVLTLIEAGRLPFDNPGTHLELTMGGQAIHLEYAGPHLALIEWAEAMRLVFLLTLLVNLALPWLLARAGYGLWSNALLILFYPFKLFILLLILAVWEITQVKMRLRTVVEPAALALVLALVSLIVAVVTHYPT